MTVVPRHAVLLDAVLLDAVLLDALLLDALPGCGHKNRFMWSTMRLTD